MSIIIQVDRRYAGFWLRRGIGTTICLGWLSISVYRADVIDTLMRMSSHIDMLEYRP